MLLEIFLLLLILLSFIYWRKRPHLFPPGPFSWPIVGNIPQVGMEPYKTVLAMKNTYGDIIGIDLGEQRAVFINDYKLVKEAFNMKAISGRPHLPHFANPEHGRIGGLLFSSQRTWKEQRQFAFTYIQSGFRNGVPVEIFIQKEANELIKDLKLLSETPVSTTTLFHISVINVLWSTIAGERYCIQDENYSKVVHHLDALSSSPATLGLLAFFPTLAKWVPKLSGYEFYIKNVKPMYAFSHKIIDAHKATYQEGVDRDFVDSFLKKIQNTTDSESSFFQTTGMENLCQALTDLFAAGTETVSTTLRWVVFLMAKYPEVQEKLSNAIQNYKHSSGNITLKDEKKLPYIEAVIMEVMRISSILALGLFHETSEDIEFHGYLIPKGTMVAPNQYGIHNDPEVWGDPESFRPERFLTDDGTEVTRHLPFIPFSVGKRVCPGESLARNELFIFTVKLFETFTVAFDPSQPTPPMKHVLGTVLLPPEHKIVFKNRQQGTF